MQKLRNVLRKKNTVCQDSPENADEYSIQLKEGDIIMSATDGVFDNLFQYEILQMVTDYKKSQPNGHLTSNQQAEELAAKLVKAAVEKFKEPTGKKSPYQRKYKKTYNATWEGVGKEDDITVLISVARRVKVHKTPTKDAVARDDDPIFAAEAIKSINQTAEQGFE